MLLKYCPGKEAAMGIIVVSLPCTAYLWAAFIRFCTNYPLQRAAVKFRFVAASCFW